MNKKMKRKLFSIILILMMMIGLMPANVYADTEIHQANITITKPVGGENPDFNPVSSEPDKYYVDLDSWAWLTAGSATPMGPSSEFKTNEQYSLRVLFRPKMGYTFADDCVFTFNGETTGSYGLDGNEFRYTYWYAADPQNSGYTVSFDASEGSGTMEAVSGVFDTFVLPPSTFTAPAGKYFSGWSVNGSTKNPGESITVLSNTTAYASWRNIPSPGFTVTYNGGNDCGGSMDSENKTDFYGELTLPDCGFTPPAGKKFLYWREGNSTWNPGDKIIISFNTTINAIWGDLPQQNPGYTVSFDGNGGTGTMASVTGVSGEYTLPANGFSAPAGKQFECWGVGPFEEKYDPGDKINVTVNTSIKALWEEITSSRQVISDVVATSADLDSIVTLYGLLKEPTFTITQGSPAYILASSGNLQWQKKIGGVWTNQVSGRFTPGEWRISSSLYIREPDGYYYELGNPTTLTVNGVPWTVENDGKPSVHPEYSYAGILSPVFTIVDDPNVQPPVSVPEVKMVMEGYEKGKLISAVNIETDAMVHIQIQGFMKLTDSNGDGEPEVEIAGASDVFEEGTVYAVVISLHAKDGYDISGLTPGTVSLDRSMIDSAEEFVEDDESFAGIYILGDMTQYTVNFETNGGSAISPVKVPNGNKVASPADPTRAYYAFEGWYSDINLTQAFDFNTPISEDITLYAKWTPSPVGGMFLMTIDFNGGTSSMPSSGEIAANSNIYFSANIGSVVTPPSGKVFAGYEIDGVKYYDGDGYTVTQNFTLKLLWEDAPVTTYTVEFDSDGGSAVTAQTIEAGQQAVQPADPTKDGFEFKGWTLNGVAYDFTTAVARNITLKAVWEVKQVTPTVTPTPTPAPSTEPATSEVPNTGDHSMNLLWFVLMIISGGMFAKIYDKKRRCTK